VRRVQRWAVGARSQSLHGCLSIMLNNLLECLSVTYNQPGAASIQDG